MVELIIERTLAAERVSFGGQCRLASSERVRPATLQATPTFGSSVYRTVHRGEEANCHFAEAARTDGHGGQGIFDGLCDREGTVIRYTQC